MTQRASTILTLFTRYFELTLGMMHYDIDYIKSRFKIIEITATRGAKGIYNRLAQVTHPDSALHTEAMKYARVHETLSEGETLAIAAANR